MIIGLALFVENGILRLAKQIVLVFAAGGLQIAVQGAFQLRLRALVGPARQSLGTAHVGADLARRDFIAAALAVDTATIWDILHVTGRRLVAVGAPSPLRFHAEDIIPDAADGGIGRKIQVASQLRLRALVGSTSCIGAALVSTLLAGGDKLPPAHPIDCAKPRDVLQGAGCLLVPRSASEVLCGIVCTETTALCATGVPADQQRPFDPVRDFYSDDVATATHHALAMASGRAPHIECRLWAPSRSSNVLTSSLRIVFSCTIPRGPTLRTAVAEVIPHTHVNRMVRGRPPQAAIEFELVIVWWKVFGLVPLTASEACPPLLLQQAEELQGLSRRMARYIEQSIIFHHREVVQCVQLRTCPLGPDLKLRGK
mmetsp:Transcript_55391/g.140058  ORF Transcript_55391/g.140058 Transcript_55391/m.140058 type:complete len:370 (-) Transcript_55391:190-1299(-)